ncbi:MAG TPA: hypothetical protein VMH24_02315, partial [Candidatus Sulfotelmatobacter sp.]|nr:hypothetical protein [Candidatus Sulfotelmatobacter sp.]
LLRPARELALAHGLVERQGWVEHAVAEAAFAAGDWATCLEAGLRAVELGERHGYDRLVVRSWAAVLPAASLRGATATLERARDWFDARQGQLPDSPYGRVLYAGARAWLARGGLDPSPRPSVAWIRPAFGQWLANGSYEWMVAGDAILDAWYAAGPPAELREALAEIGRHPPDDPFGPILAATELHGLRLAGREGRPGERQAASDRVRRLAGETRAIGLPFWTARALRILEELGAATAADLDERAALEAALGATRPVL